MSVHGKKYTHFAEYTIYIGYALPCQEEKHIFENCYSLSVAQSLSALNRLYSKTRTRKPPWSGMVRPAWERGKEAEQKKRNINYLNRSFGTESEQSS